MGGRRTRRSAAFVVAMFGPACGDDGGGAVSTTGTGTASTGADDVPGTSVAPSGSDDGPGDDAPTTLDDSTGGGSESGGPPEDGPSVAIWNVVRGETEAAFAPIPAVLHRVEIAPRVTLQAIVPPGTASVTIVVDDGPPVLDEAAPFLLDEDAEDNPIPWTLAFGSHAWEVTAHAEAGGGGETLGTASGAFELTDLGMDPAYVPLDAAGHDAWVDTELDGVMEVRSFQAEDGHVLPYRLYTPEFYDASVRYPVLIYLHGRGQRGSDNPPALYSSQLFHGPQSIVAPDIQREVPAIVVVPQCSNVPEHHEWAHWIGNSEAEPFAGLGADGSYMQHADPWPSAQAVRELVDALADELSLEPTRVYLTGESMGGFGTWEFTTRWPDVFAVGVPMAGFSDPTKVDLILDIPFWVFHGTADQSNPVEGSQNMVAALDAAGGFALYTEYRGVGHVETFNKAWIEETELLPFIFAQRKDP